MCQHCLGIIGVHVEHLVHSTITPPDLTPVFMLCNDLSVTWTVVFSSYCIAVPIQSPSTSVCISTSSFRLSLGVTHKVNISCCTCDAGGTKTTRLSCYILCSLGSDLFALHADVDECSGNVAVCSQTCTNTDGSFECGCEPGYVLDTNGFTCNGKARH